MVQQLRSKAGSVGACDRKRYAMQLNRQDPRDVSQQSHNQMANMLKSEVYAGLTVLLAGVRHRWVRDVKQKS